jgi:hypothetical protein
MAVDADGIEIALAGGVLTAKRLSIDDGKKLPAAEFAAAAAMSSGALLGAGINRG